MGGTPQERVFSKDVNKYALCGYIQMMKLTTGDMDVDNRNSAP